MAVRFSRPPELAEEFRAIQEARRRLEEAFLDLGPAGSLARQAASVLEEAQQFLQMFVPLQRWSAEEKRKKVPPEEGLILAQDLLRKGIRMLERKMRSHGRAELQRVLTLLHKALSFCASAELEYFFFRGLPMNYRLLFRIRPSLGVEIIAGGFTAVLLFYYDKAFCEDVAKWLTALFCLGIVLILRGVAHHMLPKPGVWWPKRRYIWRSLAPYAIFLSGLALIWLIARAWACWLGLAAIVITGFAFPQFWRALRVLFRPKKVLIRCTNVCHTLLIPAAEDSSGEVKVRRKGGPGGGGIFSFTTAYERIPRNRGGSVSLRGSPAPPWPR